MAQVIGFFLLCTFTVVFLISGLVLNFIQAVLYITLYNANRSLYRKLNYHLIYTSWIQIVAMAEWWSNSSCNMHGDEESLKMFGKEHSIIVMNHKYDTDWLVCWFVCEKLRMLGNAKTCAKKSLRNVPIIGWGWVFAEMIFLERNWEKDKLTFGAKLDNLMDYENPIMLLYFCEGTRFTAEKHKASMEFARARNLPQLKHHLCPRTSGFNFSVQHLKKNKKMDAIYDVQLGFPEGAIKPTFINMLHGHRFVADMHIRRIPLSDIPTDSDEATSKWLHNLYQEKDQLMDEYLKTNKFPGKCIKLQRSLRSLAHSFLWTVLIGLPFIYLIFKLITIGNFWVTTGTFTVIALLFAAMFSMVKVTESEKGSSYGKDKKTPEKSNGEALSTGDNNGACGRTNGVLVSEENLEVCKQTDPTENCEQSNNKL